MLVAVVVVAVGAGFAIILILSKLLLGHMLYNLNLKILERRHKTIRSVL